MVAVARNRSAEAAGRPVEAWIRLLRGHASAARSVEAALLRDHALTINDYEALLVLANSAEGSVRRIDLARELGLSASGVTRLLDGLEVAGLVTKQACKADARVSYAVLTDEGRAKLQQVSAAHVAALGDLFSAYSEEELETLAELLARLPGATDAIVCAADRLRDR